MRRPSRMAYPVGSNGRRISYDIVLVAIRLQPFDYLAAFVANIELVACRGIGNHLGNARNRDQSRTRSI